MSTLQKPRHQSVTRSIGYALTLGDEPAWHGLTIVMLARLEEEERAALAYAALKSLTEDNAYRVASVAMFGVLDGKVVA